MIKIIFMFYILFIFCFLYLKGIRIDCYDGNLFRADNALFRHRHNRRSFAIFTG